MALYDAFVSYSHAKDKPIAAALQTVVQKLGKPWYRRRALRVFRDDTSLSATPHLWPTIEQALGQSRFLILLASPEAAASPWVDKEVAYWLAHKGADTLLIALTDGELAWDNAVGDFGWREAIPLPPALRGRFPVEPKWVDLCAYRDGVNPRDAKFTELAADFAAAIRGMPKEDLLSQELRQQRRALTLAWSAAGSLLFLASLAGWELKAALDAERLGTVQKQIAEQQRDRAEQERTRAEHNFTAAKATVDKLITDIAVGLRDIEGIRVQTVARVLDTVKGTVEQLAARNQDDPALDETRGVMFGEFTQTYLRAGDRARALQSASEGLAAARRNAARQPEHAMWQRNIATGLVWIGILKLQAGDVRGAGTANEEALDIMRKLAARDPADTQWQADLADALDRSGRLRTQSGDFAGLQVIYAEELEIRRKLVAARPERNDWKLLLAGALDRMGRLQVQAEQFAAASQTFSESLDVVRQLAARDPANTQWQRDLSIVLSSVGDLKRREGQLEGAQWPAVSTRSRASATPEQNVPREPVSMTAARPAPSLAGCAPPTMATAGSVHANVQAMVAARPIMARAAIPASLPSPGSSSGSAQAE
jgi:tetratricopeptide (TPR) repeat protein